MIHNTMGPEKDAKDVSGVQIPSPYHRLVWSDGFRVCPDSSTPYKASSGKLILDHSAALLMTEDVAKISVDSLQVNPCVRFDFVSFRVGCAAVHTTCEFNITGLSWNDETKQEIIVASHISNIRACTVPDDCILNLITSDEVAGLTNLTSILVDVTAGGWAQQWWADDLVINWTDSSCETATCGPQVQDTVPNRGRGQGMSRIFDVYH